jgi:hypothetical protein
MVAILRFEQRQKQFPGHGPTARDAEKTSGHVGTFQLLGGQVEIPGSDAQPFDTKPEMFMPGCVGGWLNDTRHALTFISLAHSD